MRPKDLKTKIFLDGGDPKETKNLLSLLGFLDGQTTNPTLIAKNPQARERLAFGEKFTEQEVYDFYCAVVREISELIPEGSISVEVYADHSTTAEQMLRQGREMSSWIPNAHIKLPTTAEGLRAAEMSVKEKMRINMTLCFSQEQAAAVHAATIGSDKGDVFVSPFVGRLDDRRENGMDLIANILKMYLRQDSHVEVLTASVRNYDHFMCALKLGSDIITAPFSIFKEWGERGLPIPDNSYVYNAKGKQGISFGEIDLKGKWQDFAIRHELTDKGVEFFCRDWNSLIR